MLKCIAIDDEELALELLVDNISKVPFLELVASCGHPLEAMKVVQEHPADLIFLDIQMPGLTGLQFIQSFTTPCMFILITAYEQYALEGYNLNVVDYLVKPVPLERFIKASNKALELHQLRQRQKTGDKGVSDYFFVHVEYSQVKINKQDIIYIEGLKDYVKIHLASTPKAIVTRMSFKSIEDYLPVPQFARIHKSYIVSLAFITSVRKNSVFIKNHEIPIGESYRDGFMGMIEKS